MLKSNPIEKYFGIHVFDDQAMQKRLPKDVYKKLCNTIDTGEHLDLSIASVVSNAMKGWALSKGATHFTHVFQPLTNKTAEKHDSFLLPTKEGFTLELSASQLVQGEPDASSFPNGGLRSTFEARGYTVWDCTSPAYLKEDNRGNKTLCIPSVFCSYNGDSLDQKTPLLRSMEALSKQAIRILRLFGDNTTKKVTSMVGAEQEYFLVEKKHYEKRLDLRNCGRTLFGAPTCRGQELGDQYFGAIKDHILAFMADLDRELWKLGIFSKTRHNEVAPNQFEVTPMFTNTNTATDQNQLLMETMCNVAIRHNLICLLHEKPFNYVNGSGKHNNWSMATDTGLNLLDPGHTSSKDQQFLLFISAIIKAVDQHADLLRASASNVGNDHRLGGNEAPPSIVSIFMGEEITRILESFTTADNVFTKQQTFLKLGANSLPIVLKDNTDRNRTSPFAFTGNKFEFRMVPSSANIALPNTVINTIVAETLDEIATRLEKANNVSSEVVAIIEEIMKKHGRILFNGDGYSESWKMEATKRNLSFINNHVDACKALGSEKAIKLFEKYKVFSQAEAQSRVDVMLEQYILSISIEGATAIQMVQTQYMPAIMGYIKKLSEHVMATKKEGLASTVSKTELEKIDKLFQSAYQNLQSLIHAVNHVKKQNKSTLKAELTRNSIAPILKALREDIDTLELLCDARCWPVPNYTELLFSVH